MAMCRRPLILALLGAAVTAAPAAAAPHVAEFGMAVAPVGATARTASALKTVTLRPGRRFDLLGLRWRGAQGARDPHVRVRVDGRWHRWVALAPADDHGPDGAAPTHGTDVAWAGGADALQLRYRGAPRHLRVRFVRVTERPKLRPRARASQAGQPPIVTRAEWDPGNTCKPRSAPDYGQVQMAFVHHTVSANEYTAADSAAIVLSICKYHRNSNGWNDLGYNFLVDKYGRLFEGRAGGIDRAVVGAQAQGWNSQSTSVSNLGTYSDVPQTEAALTAMAQLLAWKLPLHGVPVVGQVTLTSGGGELNRYKAGADVVFERISGHRDGGKTSCPGDQLYAQLPHLRDLAAHAAPPATTPLAPGAVTLNAVTTSLVYPEPAQLTGTLTGSGRVSVQVRSGARFVTVARAQPGPDGAWAASVALARGRAMRAVQVLPNGKVGATSASIDVAVAPSVTAAAPRRVLAGRDVTLRGTIAPRKRLLSLEVSLQGTGAAMKVLRRVRVRVTRGAYALSVALTRPGLYRLKVRFAGDDGTAAAYAPDVFVRAVRRAQSVGGATAAP
jgi:hypothetical protein